MRTLHSIPPLIGGIDHISLDTRNFTPSKKDIERLCHFFSLGTLKTFQKERNVVISHSNFFIHAVTVRGQFAFKFYPQQQKENLQFEYFINRHLISHGFPTAVMLNGIDNKPCIASCGHSATCFDYIDGQQAWEHIRKKSVQIQITDRIRRLKTVLQPLSGSKIMLRQDKIPAQVKQLIRTAPSLMHFQQTNAVLRELSSILLDYKKHKQLFIRQILHNNLTLTNILVTKTETFILDLSHIREDYLLSDLAAFVISCHFMKIPSNVIQALTLRYFDRHGLKEHHLPILQILLRLSLIREYLKNAARQQTLMGQTPRHMKTYGFYLSQRAKHLARLLRQIGSRR